MATSGSDAQKSGEVSLVFGDLCHSNFEGMRQKPIWAGMIRGLLRKQEGKGDLGGTVGSEKVLFLTC